MFVFSPEENGGDADEDLAAAPGTGDPVPTAGNAGGNGSPAPAAPPTGNGEPAPAGEVGDDGAPPVGEPSEEPKPQLTGQQILDYFKESPEAQQHVQRQFTQMLQEAQTAAQQRNAEQEFQDLLKDEKYDEIGRRFVEEQRADAVRTTAEEEALRAAHSQTYAAIFAHPVMQKLTAEDRETLAPAKFDTDVAYQQALLTFIAGREASVGMEAEVQRRVNAQLEALKNMGSAEAAHLRSVSGTPSATGAPAGSQTSAELIAAGLEEQIEEARSDQL